MPPIAIKLDDYWTQNRTTRLSWNNGRLSGAGISFDVWETLFDFNSGKWFVEEAGYDFYWFSLSPIPSRQELKMFNPKELDVARASENIAKYKFLKLVPEVLQEIGCKSLEDLLEKKQVDAFLSLHDDCFFSLFSKDPGFPGTTLRLVLSVHLNYLGRTLTLQKEEEVCDWIFAVLKEHAEVFLISSPESGVLTLRYSQRSTSWLKRLLGISESGSVQIPMIG